MTDIQHTAESRYGDKGCYRQTRRQPERRKLTSRTIRPGCQHMKLDPDKVTGKPKFPWQRKKKQRYEDDQNTLQHLRRVGAVSMIQIGPDEFRSPNRRERRGAGIGKGRRAVLAQLARQSRPGLRTPVALAPSQTLAAAQATLTAVRARPYTRKAKSFRKAIAERNAIVEAQYEQMRVCWLVWRARGFVGPDPVAF